MRKLDPEERALWRKVVESVRPLDGRDLPEEEPEAEREPVAARAPRSAPSPRGPAARTSQPGTTLDGSWDRRLSRGLVQPDTMLDLHGRNLATAYDLLDRRLEQAIATDARVILLVTGKPRADDSRSAARGAIRAAMGDWLAASRHAGNIAAVRGAHPRHGGAGALYIVLRKRRARP